MHLLEKTKTQLRLMINLNSYSSGKPIGTKTGYFMITIMNLDPQHLAAPARILGDYQEEY